MQNIFAHASGLAEYSSSAPDVSISWLGILLSIVAAMVIGTLWYGPLFGKQWMKLEKISKKDLNDGSYAPIFIVAMLSTVQAFVMAHFIAYIGFFYSSFSEISVGLLTGLWIWLGFVAPVLISNSMFAKKSTALLKIHLGNQFVTLLVIGAIIAGIN